MFCMTAFILSCGGSSGGGSDDSPQNFDTPVDSTDGGDSSDSGDSGDGSDSGDSGDSGNGGDTTGDIDAAKVDQMMQMINDLGIGCTIAGDASALTSARYCLNALSLEVVDKIKQVQSSRQSNIVSALAVPLSYEFSGNCVESPQGALIVIGQLELEDPPNATRGTAEFDNYCLVGEDGSEVVITGSAAFDGQIGIEFFSEEIKINSADLNISPVPSSPIVVTSADSSATVSNFTGLKVDYSRASDDSETFDLSWDLLDIEVQKDGEAPQSARLENFSIDLDKAADNSATLSVNGASTAADGSLDIRTLTPFVLDTNGNLSDGLLQIDGADNSAVQITPEGNGYRLDVLADTDGDGEFDDYSAVLDCSELGNQLQ
jgi:hypothetical protein